MTPHGWDALLGNLPEIRRAGSFELRAYSEFMPAPRFGWRPYAGVEPGPRRDGDPFGWCVSEREEAFELRPGLESVARQVLAALRRMDEDLPAQGIGRARLLDNPYWPEELAAFKGPIPHERYVALLPLALSRTQDDKGRVRWTLFGSSEQGPERAFWRSFYTAPGKECMPEYGVDFVRRLLRAAYGESDANLADLRRAGFRVLPSGRRAAHPVWQQEPLPTWTAPFLLRKDEPLAGVRYLLTFRPFGLLPTAIKAKYLAGELHIVPFPGSLVFWGQRPFLRLSRELAYAMQIPLLTTCDRHEAPRGLRVPQSGWINEPKPGAAAAAPPRGRVRAGYRRTHRFEHVGRQEDALAGQGMEDKVLKVLFSTEPEVVGLYGKPMARNAQVWSDRYELLLDGPRASRRELHDVRTRLDAGGQFGYRFYFPPMQVGSYEVLWHRPLVAFWNAERGQAEVLADAPHGYLTGYRCRRPELARPVELWPRLLARPEYLAAVEGYAFAYEQREHQTALNAHLLLDARDTLGAHALPRGFARAIVNLPKDERLGPWLDALPRWNAGEGHGALLAQVLRRMIAPESDPALASGTGALTYGRTATRAFEVEYWKTIAQLAEGRFRAKDNADIVAEPPSAEPRPRRRDLEALGDFLLAHYRALLSAQGMRGTALVGELPFRWETDFDFEWMGGWRDNRTGAGCERNLVVVIPGRDRRRAVIMADHYDTAYMEDRYYPARGGTLERRAAAGADDNHSATAALMLGAPVFMELSCAGKLACDVWLVHLTGEEFPADCMGARHLVRCLLERRVQLKTRGATRDLSRVKIEGLFVLDMIAHNRDHDRDAFQISPGQGARALRLAYHAHVANALWNAGAQEWNESPERRGRGRGQRSPDGATIPEIARHPRLHGEVRLPRNVRSALFNSDGQIFSDAGVPVVLFMEDYDIKRKGYHDTYDTMANIDLDYGAGIAAIAIESVARAASGADALP